MVLLQVTFKDDIKVFFRNKDRIADYLNECGLALEEVVKIEEFYINNFKPSTIVDALNTAIFDAIAEEEERKNRPRKFKKPELKLVTNNNTNQAERELILVRGSELKNTYKKTK